MASVSVVYRCAVSRATSQAQGLALRAARADLWPVHLTDEGGKLTDVIRIFRRSEVVSSRILD